MQTFIKGKMQSTGMYLPTYLREKLEDKRRAIANVPEGRLRLYKKVKENF